MKFNFLFLILISALITISDTVQASPLIKGICAGNLKSQSEAESKCPEICRNPPIKWVKPGAGNWSSPSTFETGAQAAAICQGQGLSGDSVCNCKFPNFLLEKKAVKDICAGLLGNNQDAAAKCPGICEKEQVAHFNGRWTNNWKSDKSNLKENYAFDICTAAGFAQGTGRSVCNCKFGIDPQGPVLK